MFNLYIAVYAAAVKYIMIIPQMLSLLTTADAPAIIPGVAPIARPITPSARATVPIMAY